MKARSRTRTLKHCILLSKLLRLRSLPRSRLFSIFSSGVGLWRSLQENHRISIILNIKFTNNYGQAKRRLFPFYLPLPIPIISLASMIVNTPHGEVRRNRIHLNILPDKQSSTSQQNVSQQCNRPVTRSVTGTTLRPLERYHN